MAFQNRRFITKEVYSEINPLLQIFMWQSIDNMPLIQDYLQVFTLSGESGRQSIVHTQEIPEYKKEYLINSDAPVFIGKVFVIDDETHSTMLLAEEY